MKKLSAVEIEKEVLTLEKVRIGIRPYCLNFSSFTFTFEIDNAARLQYRHISVQDRGYSHASMLVRLHTVLGAEC